MRAIFISYRREDAEGQAGRLFDDLVANFGNDSVFMDVVGLEPGRDFRRAIDQQVSSCGVLLALIGRDWLNVKDESGKRRLDDPMDFVRLETASALKRDIPVIPVLVRGASMPRPEDLPEDLKDLAYRNAVELTHARWDSDLQLLVKALTPHIQQPREPGLQSVPSTSPRSRIFLPLIIFGVLVVLLVLGIAGYLVIQNSFRRPTGSVEITSSTPTPTGTRNPAATPSATRTATPIPTPTEGPSRRPVEPIAPTLLSPPDGTRFDHYPRTVTLAWERVPGASGYKVEVQFESVGWSPGQITNTHATTHTFNFVGAQPGRWRVWAIDAEGKEGPKSEWSGFYFTR